MKKYLIIVASAAVALASIVGGRYLMRHEPVTLSQQELASKPFASYAFTTGDERAEIASGLKHNLTSYLDSNYADLGYSISAPIYRDYHECDGGWRDCGVVKGIIYGPTNRVLELRVMLEKDAMTSGITNSAVTFLSKIKQRDESKK